MVSEIPFHGHDGRIYDISTYEVTVTYQSSTTGEAVPEEETKFVALVHVNGSERYRTGHHETEDEAYQDAFNWSKAQEKKHK